MYVRLCSSPQSLRVRLRLLVLTSCYVLPACAAFVILVSTLFLICTWFTLLLVNDSCFVAFDFRH